MTIFVKDNFVCINFSDGTQFSKAYPETVLEGHLKFIQENLGNEDALKKHFLNVQTMGTTLEDIKNSNILEVRGASVYMPEVSQISMPADLVNKVIEAEKEDDQLALVTIKNFWTLISLNPDARVRNNIFWFIRKWGMKITPTGLIVGYRNAVLKSSKYSQEEVKNILSEYYTAKYINKMNPAMIKWGDTTLDEAFHEVTGKDSPVYTDQHSHTTTIKLGQPVCMPREECDTDQEHSCSRGLHVGAKGWLKENYFGEVGLQVLVNPAKIVAVPTIDEYGKMRTCEYFPIAVIDFDDNGDVIEPDYDLSNDIEYLKETDYMGIINNEDFDNYRWNPSVIETNDDIYERILSRLNDL